MTQRHAPLAASRRVDRRFVCGAVLGAFAAGLGAWQFGGFRPVAEAQAPPRAFRPGQVIHTVFMNSHGNPDALKEFRQETWSLIGLDGNVKQSRIRVTDDTGKPDQEGFSDAARGLTVNVQFAPAWTPIPGLQPPGPMIRTSPRPNTVSAVMWTPESIKRGLKGTGLRAVGPVAIAGVPGTLYEERRPFESHPTARYPIPPSELRASIRRAYVGRDPAGADLGEEHGYEDRNRQFRPAAYRRLALFEILDGAPLGTFDWPHGFTDQVPATRLVPRESADAYRRQLQGGSR